MVSVKVRSVAREHKSIQIKLKRYAVELATYTQTSECFRSPPTNKTFDYRTPYTVHIAAMLWL